MRHCQLGFRFIRQSYLHQIRLKANINIVRALFLHAKERIDRAYGWHILAHGPASKKDRNMIKQSNEETQEQWLEVEE